ncbi:hypothetical protein FHG87_008066 [Trinorchestia longiramus]|nr:hypothetical protein FHG87_008066 [Trinorchestia longiramus]
MTCALYSQKLCRLKTVLMENRSSSVNGRGVILHHDNDRPHMSRGTKNLIEQFGWEVLIHSPCSPDLAPTDYHLFRSLQNHPSGQMLNSREVVEMKPVYFLSKPNEFHDGGIKKLIKRWKNVISTNGDYANDKINPPSI